MTAVSWGVGIVALIVAIILTYILYNSDISGALINPLMALIGFIDGGFALKFLKTIEEGAYIGSMGKVYVTIVVFAVSLCIMAVVDIRIAISEGGGYGLLAVATSVLFLLSYSGVVALLKAFAVIGFLSGVAELFASAFEGVWLWVFI